MNNLAIIPARGGSQRIPKKNIKDFLGKPIIAYSIEVALKSGLFEEVMVSTDDEEIAEVAINFAARVPFLRSPENASDFASTSEVINEVLNRYKTDLKREFKYVCCIYPTAPLIESQDLIDGFNLLLEKKYQALLPIVSFSCPIWRGLERNETGLTRMIWPENISARSQDLRKVYHDAGQWYWLDPLIIKEGIFTSNTGSIVLDEINVQDIDNLGDWKMAELKYKLKHEV
jgi:pseudaminic acid cytidylyltransferase